MLNATYLNGAKDSILGILSVPEAKHNVRPCHVGREVECGEVTILFPNASKPSMKAKL